MSKIRLYISSIEWFKEEYPTATKIVDMAHYLSICRSIPLFNSMANKVYYTTNLTVTKEELSLLETSNHTLVFVSKDVDKRSVLYKYCKKKNCIREQPSINAQILKKRYKNISSLAINIILRNTDDVDKRNSVFQILDSFEEVTDEKVMWVFSNDFEDKIFDTLDYLMVGNVEKFFMYYQDLKNLGESDFKFMVLLYNKLKVLLMVKPYLTRPVQEIQNNTGLNYYQVKNNLILAKKHRTSNLKKWLLECGRIERDIKYGKSEIEIDLQLLLLDILSKR